MSYDLYSFPTPAGQDVDAAFEALMEAEEAEERLPWSADQAVRAESLAASLCKLNPRFERFAFDYAEIARLQGVTEAGARAQWRHIELNSPEGDNPIQITIQADYASLGVPYWYTGDRARETISEALGYLAVFEREANWISFDPQLERLLAIPGDLDGGDLDV